jgi:EmrB/QacA subfamily drug resistance transporter
LIAVSSRYSLSLMRPMSGSEQRSANTSRSDEQAADRRRWLGLYVLCLGVLMIVLDSTIVNVALPSIRQDLGFSQSDLAWVVNAYLIAFGGLLLLAGRLGDLIGQRRIFLIGLAIFTAASLICALAQSQGVLIGARFVQGVGGAMTLAVTLGMIVTMFPQAVDQAKAIGVYTFVAVAGGSIGLIVGGVLTNAINWHWIFVVNLPIGIATWLCVMWLVDRTDGIRSSMGADIPSSVLLTAGLMIGSYAILGVESRGWGSLQTVALGGVSLVLLAAFVLRQARIANPLMPLRLFRSPTVSAANLVQVVVAPGMFGMFFVGALYMQRVLGYDALEVGLAYLPMTIVMGAMSFRFTARLNARFGGSATLMVALLALAVALVLFARTAVHGNYMADLLAPMLFFGLGAGLGFPSLTMLAMAGVEQRDSGLASGVVNTSMQVGGAIGLAVLATIAAERTGSLREHGEAALQALNGGYHLAYIVGTALVGVAAVTALATLRPDASGAAPRESRDVLGDPAYSEGA